MKHSILKIGVLAFALAALVAAPVALFDHAVICVDGDYPNPSIAPLHLQEAVADTPGGNNTLIAAAVRRSVTETKLGIYVYSRPRMTVVWGDTAHTKIVVPALDAGDIVTSVLRADTGGGTATLNWLDISDSCYYAGDTIQPWVATDSAAILLLFQDVDG